MAALSGDRDVFIRSMGTRGALGGLSRTTGDIIRVMDAFGAALVGTGRTFSPSQWKPIYDTYTPPANNSSSDFDSKGYEAQITANLSPNWRLVAN